MSKFPVINSTLSESALREYIQDRYNLSSQTTCTLFRAAMNHVYMVEDDDSRYVFRVYTHNWRSKTEIEEELRLLKYLRERGNAVAYPIADNCHEFLHKFNAPEGTRFGVLFSYAKGKKIAKFTAENSFFIGKALAEIHRSADNFALQRITYDAPTLLDQSVPKIKDFFKNPSDDIQFLESLSAFLTHKFTEIDYTQIRKGAVHLDVWFDNLHIGEENEITFFDFDFCGNGYLCFDVSYFLFQLLATNLDEKEYAIKSETFLSGYATVQELSKEELKLIPYACLSIMIYYIAMQCDRFVYWTNIFVNEDHLRRMVSNLKRWMKYHNIALNS